MKVFISWSGEKSHKVALTIRDWLPSVIQSLEPYVSSEDIDKGTRWSTDISKELEAYEYGLLCVTKENLDAPWLNFEAGALSKAFDKSKVWPFLFDVKLSEVQGPILQFQSTIFNKADVFKLLQSLNKALNEESLQNDRIVKGFEVWWHELEKKLKEIESKAPSTTEKEDKTETIDLVSSSADILEEILDLVRNQQKLLNSPESLLPKSYLDLLIKRITGDNRKQPEEIFSHSVWNELFNTYDNLLKTIESNTLEEPVRRNKLIGIINEMGQMLAFIDRKFLKRRSNRIFWTEKEVM